MNVCFPVVENRGLDSQVYNHFSCAPEFVVVDMITNEATTINDSGKILQYGTCDPIAELDGHQVDAMVVGGISDAVLHKLTRAGLRVFQAKKWTIGENLVLFMENGLSELLPEQEDLHGHNHGFVSKGQVS